MQAVSNAGFPIAPSHVVFFTRTEVIMVTNGEQKLPRKK
jgi:hypothetical protein